MLYEGRKYFYGIFSRKWERVMKMIGKKKLCKILLLAFVCSLVIPSFALARPDFTANWDADHSKVAEKFKDLTEWFYKSILPLIGVIGLAIGAGAYIFGGERAKERVVSALVGCAIAAASIMIVSMLFKLFGGAASGTGA